MNEFAAKKMRYTNLVSLGTVSESALPRQEADEGVGLHRNQRKGVISECTQSHDSRTYTFAREVSPDLLGSFRNLWLEIPLGKSSIIPSPCSMQVGG